MTDDERDEPELPWHCFVCGRKFDSPDTTNLSRWPATIFVAIGNWGSTLFDPSPREGRCELVAVICDPCILKRFHRVSQVGGHIPEEYTKLPPRDEIQEWIDSSKSEPIE